MSAAGVSSTLRIGGRSVRGAAGLALMLHGLPSSVRKGKASHLNVSIREQLGDAAGPVAVSVSGVAGSFSASSTAGGKLHLTLHPKRRGAIKLTFSGSGFQSASRTLRVR